MSRITASTSIREVKPEEVPRFVDIFCQNVVTVVNGGLDFATNFNCKVVSVVFTAANTDTTVVHNLGRVASKYFPISKTVATDVYDGSVPSSSSAIILRATVPSTVTLVVF